mgnify:CR=1 FL=1
MQWHGSTYTITTSTSHFFAPIKMLTLQYHIPFHSMLLIMQIFMFDVSKFPFNALVYAKWHVCCFKNLCWSLPLSKHILSPSDFSITHLVIFWTDISTLHNRAYGSFFPNNYSHLNLTNCGMQIFNREIFLKWSISI